MLDFKRITYKNFQSVGNMPITILLDKSPTTLVAGSNGSGKSTLLEALSYALFGKPLKKLVLGGLINTINKKGLHVEVEFTAAGKAYKVIRGQKPAVLELWVDGTMVDQSASSADYQKKIEYILGMDHKLFTQMVVLNRERYVPFMDLTTGDRRKVIEDILDISVFSRMTDIAKEKRKQIMVDLQTANTDYVRAKTAHEAQEGLVAQLRQVSDGQVKDLTDSLNAVNAQIADLGVENDELRASLAAYGDLTAAGAVIMGKQRKFTELVSTMNAQRNAATKTLTFFTSDAGCPECGQEIAHDLKQLKESECTGKIDKIDADKAKVDEAIAAINTQWSDHQQKVNSVSDINRQIYGNSQRMSTLTQQANEITRAITKHQQSNNLDQQVEVCDTMKVTMDECFERYNALVADASVYTTCLEVLSDTGVKATVIRDYIQFINGRINQYLNSMDFFINITLDDQFNDKINSINRENFTYDNLSTGQKTRVNLAIWMALIEVASLKNSLSTNILFLDEILENLDQEGVAMFMGIVREHMPNKNVFVVTQRAEEFKDHFRSELRFKLTEGFTQML